MWRYIQLVLVSLALFVGTCSSFVVLPSVTPHISNVDARPKLAPYSAGININRGSSPTGLNAFVDTVATFYKTKPYLAAFITCGIKASAADAIAQRIEMSKKSQEKANLRRNAAYILYGGGYQGIFQEYLYNHIFPLLFGAGTDVLTVFNKVAFDMFVLMPFLCLPFSYLSKSAIFGYSPIEAIRRYMGDVRVRGLLKKCWGIWIPVQCMTFSIVPEFLRISFIAFVSFFWLIILSKVSAKGEMDTMDEDDTQPKLCSLQNSSEMCMQSNPH